MAIGQLDVKLSLDTAEFSTNASKAQKDAERLSKAIGAAFGVGVGLAAVAGFKALQDALSDVTKEAEKFVSLASSLGEIGGATALQASALAFESVGVSAEGASKAIETFSKVAIDSVMGKATDATRAAKALGVTFQETGGQAQNSIEQIQRLINTFAGYRDSVQKAAAVQALFGVQGSDAAKLLSQTGDAFIKNQQAAERNAAALQGLAGAWSDFRSDVQSALGGVMADIAPALTDAIDLVRGFATTIDDVLGGLGEAFSGDAGAGAFADVVVAAFRALAKGVLESVISVTDAINDLRSALGVAQKAGSIVGGMFEAGSKSIAEGQDLSRVMAEVGASFLGSAAEIREGASAFDEAFSDVSAATTKLSVSTRADLMLGLNAAGAGIDALTTKANAAKGPLADLGNVFDKIGGGGKKGGGGGKSEADRQAEALKRWADQMIRSVDPAIAYQEQVDKLNQAFAAGLVTGDQYAAILAKIGQQHPPSDYAKSINDFQEGLKSFADSAASSLANAIVEGEDLGDVFASLAKQLAAMVIQTLILKPLFDSLASSLSNLGGGGGILGLLSGGDAPAGWGDPVVFGAAAGVAMAGAITGAAQALAASGRSSARAGANVGGVQNTIGSISMSISPDRGDVTSDTKTGAKLGDRFVKLIQAEMVRQSRPGGLLRQ